MQNKAIMCKRKQFSFLWNFYQFWQKQAWRVRLPKNLGGHSPYIPHDIGRGMAVNSIFDCIL